MSFNPDRWIAAAELGEVIRLQNEAMEQLRQFMKNRPWALPPNVGYMVEDNLKENVQMLYREMNHMHKPQQEKKRHVCSQCHMVFAVALPGGMCDECRSKPAGQPAAYGSWPVTPESEAVTVADTTPLPADMESELDSPAVKEAKEVGTGDSPEVVPGAG